MTLFLTERSDSENCENWGKTDIELSDIDDLLLLICEALFQLLLLWAVMWWQWGEGIDIVIVLVLTIVLTNL